jgi:hypothetical protein
MIKIFVKIVFLVCISFAFVFAVYKVDSVYLFPYFRYRELGPGGVLFIEGLISLLVGFLALIGSGGWTMISQVAAMLASAAKALGKDDKEIIGPGEVYRREAWKPGGSASLAVVFIIAGVALILMSFGHYY